MVRRVTINAFVTNDGNTFLTEEEAERHADILKRTKYFKVDHTPELSGLGELVKHTYVSAIPRRNNLGHELMVEKWAYETFGSRAAYAQGIMLVPNWEITKVEKDEIPRHEIITELKE